jgi:hypothetical protein
MKTTFVGLPTALQDSVMTGNELVMTRILLTSQGAASTGPAGAVLRMSAQ